MLNCKECTDEKFREAMDIIKTKPLTLVPTDLLYIAFTKYAADARSLGQVAESPYHFEILRSARTTRNTFGEELERRGIRVMY